MNCIVLSFVAVLALVSGKDVTEGTQNNLERKIFDEKREASPAIWRQVQNITVNTTDPDVISRIVITDLRPDKDGDANILEGGQGQNTVTIELKSPTVLRGFDFRVEVYAVPKDQANNNGGILNPSQIGNNNFDEVKENQDKTKSSSTTEGNASTKIDGVPPKTIGDDFSTKLPVPLSTEIQIQDSKRRVRSTPTLNPTEQHTTQKIQDTTTPKAPSVISNDTIFRIPVQVDQTKSEDDAKTNKPEVELKSKHIIPGTLKPTTEKLETEEHLKHDQERHARDTSTPSSVDKTEKKLTDLKHTLPKQDDVISSELDDKKDLKHDQVRHARDTSSTPSSVDKTEKKLTDLKHTLPKQDDVIPSELDDKKDLKHDQARRARDTSTPSSVDKTEKKLTDLKHTLPKQDDVIPSELDGKKDGITTEKSKVSSTTAKAATEKNEDLKHVQKIPSGPLTFPEERKVREATDAIVTKIGLDKPKEKPEDKPAPYVPAVVTLQKTVTEPSATAKTTGISTTVKAGLKSSSSTESSEEVDGKGSSTSKPVTPVISIQ